MNTNYNDDGLNLEIGYTVYCTKNTHLNLLTMVNINADMYEANICMLRKKKICFKKVIAYECDILSI